MNSYRNSYRDVILCSCFFFGIKNFVNRKKKKGVVYKNVVQKYRQIKELAVNYRFERVFFVCEKVYEKINLRVPFNGSYLHTECETVKKERKVEEKEKEIKETDINDRTEKTEIAIEKIDKNEKTNKENEEGTKSCVLDTEEVEKEEIIMPDELNDEMKNKIESILNKYTVVLFMKGTALNPFCKYSKEALYILKLNRVKEIHTVDVLNDLQLRRCLKLYSNWPTFPQLYVHGKFIGGIDKVKELHENKQLEQILVQPKK